MKKNPLQRVSLVESSDSAPLSAQQQTFNQLIKQIEQLRQQLQAWQQMIPLYQQQYHAEFAPLLAQFNQQQAQLLRQFNLAYDDRCFNNSDKKRLSQIICQIADGLLGEVEDSEIEQILRMHRAAEAEITQPATIEAPAAPTLSQEQDPLEPWEIAALEREQQKQQRQAQRKSARARAEETRRQPPLEDVSRSLREVYRKLASSLHPDREQDESELARKTELMQRVNIAYGNKDLLQLLELQLETEQIDQRSLQALNLERLQHYNQILSQQQTELQQEIQDIEQSFGLLPQQRKRPAHSPEAVLRKLQSQTRQLQSDSASLSHQLALFSQPQQIARWLHSGG